MGTFTQRLTLHGPSANGNTPPSVEVDALVDTGAMFSAIPASVLRSLGVQPFRTLPVHFANGATEEWEMGEVEAELEGERVPILVFFGSEDAPSLIGTHALEGFLRMVEPISKKLVRQDAFLMRASRDLA
jgi:predicted aspartyl protease